MRKRLRLAFAAIGGLVFCVLIATALLNREPTYEGLTMGDWLRTVEGPGGNKLRIQEPVGGYAPATVPLLTLGTNNLNLLVRRIAYDPQKDLIRQTLSRLPSSLKSKPWAERFAARRDTRASDAATILERIGTNAAPALPQLAAIAARDNFAAFRAVHVLGNLGEDGLASVAATAAHSTNALLRQDAFVVLCHHLDSEVTLAALTNALTDTDPAIRGMAAQYLKHHHRSPDGIPMSR